MGHPALVVCVGGGRMPQIFAPEERGKRALEKKNGEKKIWVHVNDGHPKEGPKKKKRQAVHPGKGGEASVEKRKGWVDVQIVWRAQKM